MMSKKTKGITRSEFVAQLKADIEAFDRYWAEKYPHLGEPGPDSKKPIEQQGQLAFGDWFEQYLAFDREESQ